MSTTLRIGQKSAEVGNLQRFLNRSGCVDADGKALVVDEGFGVRTAYALRAWQALAGTKITGEVDEWTRTLLTRHGFIPFIQARNYTALYPALRASPDWIVIHTMECPERFTAAEDVGLWFAGKSAYPPPVASAHYGVDPDGVVQYVRESDVAWHAPNANRRGIGIELAGRANQTADQWADDASTEILKRAARLCGEICKRRGIEVVKLSVDELIEGKRSGFLGHVDATLMTPKKSGHSDPGPNFPWSFFLALVRECM